MAYFFIGGKKILKTIQRDWHNSKTGFDLMNKLMKFQMYNCKLNCVVVTIARVSALEVVKISKDKDETRRAAIFLLVDLICWISK